MAADYPFGIFKLVLPCNGPLTIIPNKLIQNSFVPPTGELCILIRSVQLVDVPSDRLYLSAKN
jgi:hypothetical protein